MQRRVRVQMDALEAAFDDGGREHANVLDLATGEAVMVTDE